MTNDIISYQYITDVNLYRYFINSDNVILIGDLEDEERFYIYSL